MQICVKCPSLADSSKKQLCKSCYNKGFREYRKKNPKIFKKLNRTHLLKTKYGITQNEYLAMYEEQDGKCSICFEAKELLNIDHDHITGKVRSLLCTYCNILVGNIERMDVNKYLEYVNKHANLR